MSHSTPILSSKNQSADHLIQVISSPIQSLGYQVIHLELQTHLQKTLRVFIDHLDPAAAKGIGIEDCVKVSKILDEFLDQNEYMNGLLPTTYELEVSSPGANRPLRTLRDFNSFAGKEVKLSLFRPLTAEESENPSYLEKNIRQKNFLGTLLGTRDDKVLLSLSANEKKDSKKKSAAQEKATLVTNSVKGSTVSIPLHLISKANLEPEFNFEGSDERE